MATRHGTDAPAGAHSEADAPAQSLGSTATKDWTLVWIDARGATIMRLDEGRIGAQRIQSAVPPRRSSTGRVRQEAQSASDARRLEHLARFIDEVVAQLNADHAIAILGPGTVRDHLESALRKVDDGLHRSRPLTCEPADRLTRAELGQRLRDLAGVPRRRRTLGGHRWSGAQDTQPSGHVRPPRGVVEKPPRDRHPLNEDELEV